MTFKEKSTINFTHDGIFITIQYTLYRESHEDLDNTIQPWVDYYFEFFKYNLKHKLNYSFINKKNKYFFGKY